MKQYVFLVPNCRNTDRAEHPQETRDSFGAMLVDLFGGYSISHSPVLGAWRDPETNEVIVDNNWEFRVATDNEIGVINVCKAACEHFDQKCIYLVLPTNETLLVDAAFTDYPVAA